MATATARSYVATSYSINSRIYSLERAGLTHELKFKLFDEIANDAGVEMLFSLDSDSPDRGIFEEIHKDFKILISNVANALNHLFHADALTLPLNMKPSAPAALEHGEANLVKKKSTNSPVKLTFDKVLKWVHLFHPHYQTSSKCMFSSREDLDGRDDPAVPNVYKECRYLAQVVVLTLSNMGELRLLPNLLPYEYRMLCSADSVEYALRSEDADEISRTLLCLRIFGYHEEQASDCKTSGVSGAISTVDAGVVTNQTLKRLVDWLVNQQGRDGSWHPNTKWNPEAENGQYDHVHSTCLVCVSLLPLRFRGFGPAQSGCGSLLNEWCQAYNKQLTQGGAGDENNHQSGRTQSCAGVTTSTRDHLEHVFMLYDPALAANKWLEEKPLLDKCRTKLDVLLNHYRRMERMGDQAASASESESDAESMSSSSAASIVGLSQRSAKRVLDSNVRVKALRKVAQGLKSEYHFGQRLISSIKRWDGEQYPERDALINAVDDDYNVKVGGVSVSLLTLFQQAAKQGGMQVKQPDAVWANIARACEVPQSVHKAGAQVKKLYRQYMRAWANTMVDTKLNGGVTKGGSRPKKRQKQSHEMELGV